MSSLNELMKSQIALLAGDDLEDEEEIRDVRRSIESCPHCRQHWVRLRGCVDVLDRAGRSTERVSSPSLWPSIGSRLQRTSYVRRDRFNGWVPALSMAAACIALLVAGQMDGFSPQELPASDHAGLFGGEMRSINFVRPQPIEVSPMEGSVFGGMGTFRYDLSYPNRGGNGYDASIGYGWQRR
jgi:hypothetical protein